MATASACKTMFINISPSSSELWRVNGQEPAAAGHIPGAAAEVGESTGQEDSQEASATRALCTLFTTHHHEGPAQPVNEKAQSTAPHRQDQVVEWMRGGVFWISIMTMFVCCGIAVVDSVQGFSTVLQLTKSFTLTSLFLRDLCTVLSPALLFSLISCAPPSAQREKVHLVRTACCWAWAGTTYDWLSKNRYGGMQICGTWRHLCCVQNWLNEIFKRLKTVVFRSRSWSSHVASVCEQLWVFRD